MMISKYEIAAAAAKVTVFKQDELEDLQYGIKQLEIKLCSTQEENAALKKEIDKLEIAKSRLIDRVLSLERSNGGYMI